MNLKVGMYLRHKGLEGEAPIIQKITKLQKPGRCGAKYNVYTDKCLDWFIDSDYIDINASKYDFDIIKLIEVGDILEFDDDKDIYRVTQVPNELCDCFYLEFNYSKEYNVEDIYVSKEHMKESLKTITTHEYFDNGKYEVKEC